MKKILAMLLAAGMTLSLSACGGSEPIETQEDTLPLPLWAQDEQDRTEASETTVQTAAAETTEETISQVTEPETTEESEETAAGETAASEEETVPESRQETEAETLPQSIDPAKYKMEEKFESITAETVYVKKSVNIRPQANVNCTALGRLPAGTALIRIGTSKDSWSAVIYEEKVRYVSSDYLSTDEQPEETRNPNIPSEREVDDMVYTVDDVNMREGPGFDRAILCRVPEFIELHRTGIVSSGWSKVTYQDKEGYISTGYLAEKHPGQSDAPEEEAVSDTVYTTREVNLRRGPGTEMAIIGRIPQGTELKRSAITSSGWGKVSYEGNVGYVSGDYLSTTPPAEG